MSACILNHHMSDLMHDSEVMNPNVSKLRILSWFFGRKSPLFSVKIQILKIRMHRHVGEDVCIHIKSSYGWSNIQLLSYEPKCVKIEDFSWFFGRKSPIFSLKIEILKIRKHRHVAEYVSFYEQAAVQQHIPRLPFLGGDRSVYVFLNRQVDMACKHWCT